MSKFQSIKNKLCDCHEYKSLIECQKITLNRSDLKLYIKEYDEAQKSKQSWHLPITILFSLLIAVTTTSFQPNISIPFSNIKLEIPSGMSLVLWFSTCLTTIWTLLAFRKCRTAKNPTELLLNKINLSILNKPDRTSVFIIKRSTPDGQIELLVEKKKSWSCYFLPYVKQLELTEYSSNQKTGTTESLGNKLGRDAKDIKIELLQNFNFKSEKFDPPQKVVKEYHFEVFHVSITGAPFASPEFSVGDRAYHWKSLNDLEQDEDTKRNNKDILNHLRDNYNELIVKVSNHDA
ncbi:hypothetical protein [Pseudomonas kurunegalensis]|uniref:hypothetical protein n=1 Tax=Pseudomonas kurunegalensis TaxID=485880 RepID=UPI002363239B|nr:hypothetical protein [Pseudomonas kurunegalensis]MDD2136769.1 hypothetical protein [Pseudomonas kurunegalensis]